MLQQTFYIQKNFSPDNRAVYEIILKNMVQPDRRQYDTAHAHCMLNNYGYRHTLRICNIYCLSMVTTVVRTRLNPLNAELNSICHLLALLGVHHFLHVSRIRVNVNVTSPVFFWIAGQQNVLIAVNISLIKVTFI